MKIESPSELIKAADLGRSTVVVVDFQNDFCHNDGSYGRAGYDTSMVQKAASTAEAFLERARLSEIPIIHVRTHHSQWTDSPAKIRRINAAATGKGLGLDYANQCKPGTWGAEFYVAPTRDEYIVTKHRYSAFIETDLELVLRSISSSTIVLMGCVTNVCVDSTARDGYMRDYSVVVVEDCVGAMTKEEHDASLYTLGRYFATIANSEVVLQAWAELAPNA